MDENWESGVEKTFSASVSQEENVYVAQCLEIDVASQGTTEYEALQNLREALELYFDPPQATNAPLVKTIKVEVGAA